MGYPPKMELYADALKLAFSSTGAFPNLQFDNTCTVFYHPPPPKKIHEFLWSPLRAISFLAIIFTCTYILKC